MPALFDRTIKVSTQGHFLHTDKLNLVIFFVLRHCDVARQIEKVVTLSLPNVLDIWNLYYWYLEST